MSTPRVAYLVSLHSSDGRNEEQLPPSPIVSHDGDVLKTRKKVTSACLSCKSSKARCDGDQPCLRCVKKTLVCIAGANNDLRQRGNLKRKYEEMQDKNQLLHDLMALIRFENDANVNQALSLIRSNASHYEMRQFLLQLKNESTAKGRTSSEETESMPTSMEVLISPTPEADPLSKQMRHASHPTISRGVLSVDRMTDYPIHQVPSSVWTSVTRDDHLVSHLVSLWATWEHLCPDGIVLELFLRDMRAENLTSAFCSPFLVNCVLAAGCPYSDYEEVRTIKGEASELFRLFVEEAKSHLAEDPALSITTTQGLMLLYLTTSKMHNNGYSRQFLTQAVAMCEELMGSRKNILRTAKSENEEHELSYVIDFTVWGVLAAIVTDFVRWRRPVLLPVFHRLYPKASSVALRLHQQRWIPYPREAGTQVSSYDTVMQHHARLGAIQQKLSTVLFSHSGESDSDAKAVQQGALAEIDSKLDFWYNELPSRFKDIGSLLSPCVIQLRWSWSYVKMVIITNQLRLHSQKRNSHFAGSNEKQSIADRDSFRTRLLDLALGVADLIQCFRRSSIDVSRINTVCCPTLYLAMDIFVDTDNLWSVNAHNQRHDFQVVEICIVLRAIARRSPWAIATFRAAQLNYRSRGVEMPEASLKLFEEFETSDIKLMDVKMPPTNMLSHLGFPSSDDDAEAASEQASETKDA